MSHLRTGIGTSEHDDAARAGREATEAALRDLRRTEPATPALALVYTSVKYDLEALLAAIRGVLGDTPLVGATTSGHFHTGTLVPAERGVAVLVMSAGPYRFATASATGLAADSAGTGQRLARGARDAIGADRRDHGALLLLSCGLVGDHQQLINGMYRVTGAGVPVVGGIASDDRKMTGTFVFRDDQVLSDAAVAVWIDAPAPLVVSHDHGWLPLGLPMPITGVDGSTVHTIAGRPAAEVFQEQTRHAESEDYQPEVRFLGEAGRCLGLIEPDGSRVLRGAFARDNGEVNTWVPLPAYAAVQVMHCSQDSLLGACDTVVDRALAGAGDSGRPPAGVVLGFSCVSRLRFLGDRAPEEPQRLQASAGHIPTFGFFTYGEFARTVSVNGVHNATITALTL